MFSVFTYCFVFMIAFCRDNARQKKLMSMRSGPKTRFVLTVALRVAFVVHILLVFLLSLHISLEVVVLHNLLLFFCGFVIF